MSDKKKDLSQFFTLDSEHKILDIGIPFFIIKRMDFEQRKASEQLNASLRDPKQTMLTSIDLEHIEAVKNSFRPFNPIDKSETVDFFEGCRSTISSLIALFHHINQDTERATGKVSKVLNAVVDTLGGVLCRVHEVTVEKEMEVFGGPRDDQSKDQSGSASRKPEPNKFLNLINEELKRLQARNHNKK